MKNYTQLDWIKKQLRKNKRITRNSCLKNYISRLGAYILKLKSEGWVFRTSYIPAPLDGLDYEYRVIKAPKDVR